MNKAGVVLVLYHPDYTLAARRIRQFREEGLMVAATDNTPGNVDGELVTMAGEDPGFLYIPLGNNKGIAAAQNEAIKKLLERKRLEYLLFFDQDTLAEKGYAGQILEALRKLETRNPPVAAVGPKLIHAVTGTPYRALRNRKSTNELTEVRQLISSGSIVPVRVLEEVGLMEEALFIDLVDFEWCWRARSKGYRCYQDNHVQIRHLVGEQSTNLGGWHTIIWSPVRYYYQYRNYLVLLRRPYVPLYWKLSNGIKKLTFLFLVLFVLNDKKNRFRYIFRGIHDGFKGSASDSV
jgi:rhamnosyltransferase